MQILETFKNYFGEELNRRDGVTLSKAVKRFDNSLREEKLASVKDALDSLRSLFGKSGELPNTEIGGHPDFDYLVGTSDIEKSSIVTLFMDIESSTRLGILYPVKDVFIIKNSFIKMAISVVRALDGHVHRIMGDAVMAYFGGRETCDNNLIDSINCASTLAYLVKGSVIPKLEELGYKNSEFGIRIGLDYGAEKTVLWSSYGIGKFTEVTATSFFVDIASKLQSQAGRNQIMLGQSLVERLDFPDKFLEVKKSTQGGINKESPYVKPNITDAKGQKINYKKFILKSEEYLRNTAFPVENANNVVTYLPVATNSMSVRIEVFKDEEEIDKIGDILPGSFSVPKGSWIKFSVLLNYQPQLPVKFIFEVTNHGKEAKKAGLKEDGSSDYHNHLKEYDRPYFKAGGVATHKEQASYRGFQEMKIKIVKGSGKVLHNNSMGIYIQ